MTIRSMQLRSDNPAGRFSGVLPGLAAIAVAIAGLNSATAQEFFGGGQIVGEQIVGEQIMGDYSVDGSSYVGDMASADYTVGQDGSVISGDSESSFVGTEGFSSGQCIGRAYGQPDLFYNYFTQGNCNAANAQMYLSPLPVPPNVGHTFMTYQPFYPEEMLYWHKNKFHNYYDNGRGLNRTKATYFSPPIRQAASNFYWNYLRIPR